MDTLNGGKVLVSVDDCTLNVFKDDSVALIRVEC